MVQPASGNPTVPPRLASLDAFRGFTIAGMIFVIMVAGYKDLPHTFPAFGSAPVSTWKHAGEDGESEEWQHWNGDHTFHEGKVVRVLDGGKYDVEITRQEGAGPTTFNAAHIRHSKPLRTGDKIIGVIPN